jgi:hypothetical protein
MSLAVGLAGLLSAQLYLAGTLFDESRIWLPDPLPTLNTPGMSIVPWRTSLIDADRADHRAVCPNEKFTGVEVLHRSFQTVC